MDNSLLDIGAQCSVPSCSVQDFLPIFCPSCSQYFCQDHVHSDLHSCPTPTPPAQSDTQHDKLQRCALDNCNKLSLDAYNETTAAACPTCKRSFCAHHRHPISHKCTSTTTLSQAPASTKNEKARALLAKVSSSSTAKAPFRRSTKLPTDPAKLAAYRKVEVMKMRHKSVPLDPKDMAASPPLDQRLYIKVKQGDKEKVFWTRKVCMTS
ncbi:hypothetical protein P691DRAFT_663715 [Macrolepiota fuliginosa MF-IS2]|uniref:AN1-type domain-containing protein n=1 Tax=Macrolepiota fuliginosa MF-IS2 TaxID=1400762 RepID=A0A9P5XK60_9AGAR|nr:hypothetical protein P691DRAFT_663715 [Macrolepiota fuliginosa MF-IS2]